MDNYDALLDRAVELGLVLPSCSQCDGTTNVEVYTSWANGGHGTEACPADHCGLYGRDRSRAAVLLALVEASTRVDFRRGGAIGYVVYLSHGTVHRTHDPDPVTAALRAFVAAHS